MKEETDIIFEGTTMKWYEFKNKHNDEIDMIFCNIDINEIYDINKFDKIL